MYITAGYALCRAFAQAHSKLCDGSDWIVVVPKTDLVLFRGIHAAFFTLYFERCSDDIGRTHVNFIINLHTRKSTNGAQNSGRWTAQPTRAYWEPVPECTLFTPVQGSTLTCVVGGCHYPACWIWIRVLAQPLSASTICVSVFTSAICCTGSPPARGSTASTVSIPRGPLVLAALDLSPRLQVFHSELRAGEFTGRALCNARFPVATYMQYRLYVGYDPPPPNRMHRIHPLGA